MCGRDLVRFYNLLICYIELLVFPIKHRMKAPSPLALVIFSRVKVAISDFVLPTHSFLGQKGQVEKRL